MGSHIPKGLSNLGILFLPLECQNAQHQHSLSYHHPLGEEEGLNYLASSPPSQDLMLDKEVWLDVGLGRASSQALTRPMPNGHL